MPMGGGTYDLSRNQTDPFAASANQSAGTVINFGAGAAVRGDANEQTSRASASGAASKGPASSDLQDGEVTGGGAGGPNWALLGTIAGAAVLIAAIILLKK